MSDLRLPPGLHPGMGSTPPPADEQRRAAAVHLAIASYGEGGVSDTGKLVDRAMRISQFIAGES